MIIDIRTYSALRKSHLLLTTAQFSFPSILVYFQQFKLRRRPAPKQDFRCRNKSQQKEVYKLNLTSHIVLRHVLARYYDLWRIYTTFQATVERVLRAHHVFIPQILKLQRTQPASVTLALTFLNRLHTQMCNQAKLSANSRYVSSQFERTFALMV